MSGERWARTAERIGELEQRRRAELTERVRGFVQPRGDERALDVGTGTGALAFALAPHVDEVLAIDRVPELLDEARSRGTAFPNVTFAEGDATALDLTTGSFDLTGCARTLHHVRRPELVVAELARVARPGGRVLVIDQIAPIDPLLAVELDRFERARDPEHERLLPDVDVRALLEANGLVVVRTHFAEEPRDLDRYLDLAACEGEARERALALAPRGYTALVGWYLAEKPLPRT
ncbi:MAG TPA: methyltransferase domain-containing protein [Gaiellaceae bacterium]|nr:methyltransferase domain-containing protein [Gaiellaceae bacterium]